MSGRRGAHAFFRRSVVAAAGLRAPIERTGQTAVLDRRLPFLVGGEIRPARRICSRRRRSAAPRPASTSTARAPSTAACGWACNGLPLMGTGDWNDGMNRIGHQGRGESVWMAWFLCEVVRLALPWAEAAMPRVAHWRQALQGWPQALERRAWDGRWYLRAFFDDGSPLGSAADDECRIDLIAGRPGRCCRRRRRAARPPGDGQRLDAPVRHRAPPAGAARPPLQHHQPDAGWHPGHPPGVRENGGQYSHAAVWGLMAMLRFGQADRAWRSTPA